MRSGGGAPESISYGYDPAGNRTSQSGSVLNGTLSYNADDELTAYTYNGGSSPSATFGYDANGERTSETTAITPSFSGYGSTFGYDFEGNLTGITASGNGSVSFEYDGLDRQLGWQSNGSRLDYQLDGDAVLTETNQTTSRVNLYGNGLVMSGGETLLGDGMGATRQTTNSGQSVQWSSGYTAFGQSVGQAGSTNNHYAWGAGSGYRSDGFGPSDANALVKVGCRYYDPEFGSFLTRDTMLAEKPYVYCNGDPVNSTDPTGHDSHFTPDGLGTIAATVLAAAVALLAIAYLAPAITLTVAGALIAGAIVLAVLAVGIAIAAIATNMKGGAEGAAEGVGREAGDSARSGSGGLPGGTLPGAEYDYYSRGQDGIWRQTGSGPYQPGVTVDSEPPNPHQ